MLHIQFTAIHSTDTNLFNTTKQANLAPMSNKHYLLYSLKSPEVISTVQSGVLSVYKTILKDHIVFQPKRSPCWGLRSFWVYLPPGLLGLCHDQTLATVIKPTYISLYQTYVRSPSDKLSDRDSLSVLSLSNTPHVA